MNLKHATVVLDGVFRHIPQKAIGIILQFSSVRRISFTTPPDRSAALAEQAKALYSEFVGAQDRGDPAFKFGDFVSAHLSAAPEESDVVHDLLAYLAESMIEMNREKNNEIKGFLRWLEGEIGALAKNKKKLKEGYDPTRREPKEKLHAEYNASIGKLEPFLSVHFDLKGKLYSACGNYLKPGSDGTGNFRRDQKKG